MFRVIVYFLLLTTGFISLNGNVFAENQAPDEENCIMCHKYPGLSLVDENGYLRLFYIDQDAYKHSVHSKVKCSGCHN